MSKPASAPGRWRFSLRSLLLITVMAAVIAWVASEYHEALNTIALSDAVAIFNAMANSDEVGGQEPPLTEAEVLAAVRRQLSTMSAERRVIDAYGKILRTRRLPEHARLHFINRYTTQAGSKTVWWINLDVIFNDGAGYGLRIRENNLPVAATAPYLQPTPTNTPSLLETRTGFKTGG